MIKNKIFNKIIGVLMMLFFSIGCQLDNNSDNNSIEFKTIKFSESIEEYNFTSIEDLTFTSYDGVEISAYVCLPAVNNDVKLPAIIFMHGWTGDKFQLIEIAKKYASLGYIAGGYTTRGFGREDENGSKDFVTFGGEKDIQDFSAFVDWLEDNTQVDVNKIGGLGYSYGGGILLKALGLEKRLKTVISRNPWTNQVDHLYGGNTPRMKGVEILDLGAKKFPGYMDSEGKKKFEDFKNRVNVEESLQWLKEISPISYIDELNSRGDEVSVFIKKGFGDFLLHVNAIIDYYNKLEIPKKLYLNRSVHATDCFAEDPIKDFDKGQEWFDYHLKGIENGIMNDKVGIVAYNSEKNEVYLEKHISWPPENIFIKKYFPGPRYWIGNGQLLDSQYDGNFRNWIETTKMGSGVSNGIPWVSQMRWQHYLKPIESMLRLINHERAIIYESEKLDEELKIRGIPAVDLLVSSDKPVKELQLVAYIYEVDDHGIGTLLTHGPLTLNYEEPNSIVRASIKFMSLAHDVKKGHRIALAIDTKDPLFMNPPFEDYRVYFNLSDSRGKNSILQIPYVK